MVDFRRRRHTEQQAQTRNETCIDEVKTPRMWDKLWDLFTQHAPGDWESERGPSSHPPAGGQVGQLSPQHLHDHLIIQSQVEMVLIQELEIEGR